MNIYQLQYSVSGGPGWWQGALALSPSFGGVGEAAVCNDVTDAGVGYMFSGPNVWSIWAKNDMTANTWGLFVNWGAMGPQGTTQSHDNRWLGATWGTTNPHTHSEFSDGTQSPLLVQAGAPWEPTVNTPLIPFAPYAPISVSNSGTGWNGPNCPIVNNIVDPDSLLPLNPPARGCSAGA